MIILSKKISYKLNYLASAIGMPVPKTVPFPKKVQMYETFKDQALDTQGSPTSSVIDYDALGLAGNLDTKNICVDLKYCTGEDADYVRGFFAREAAQSYEFIGKIDKTDLNGQVKKEGEKKAIPMFRPGFGELTGEELKDMQAKNQKFNDAMLSTKGGSKVGKTMSFKERKVELKSGSVETELENMEKKIDHM